MRYYRIVFLVFIIFFSFFASLNFIKVLNAKGLENINYEFSQTDYYDYNNNIIDDLITITKPYNYSNFNDNEFGAEGLEIDFIDEYNGNGALMRINSYFGYNTLYVDDDLIDASTMSTHLINADNFLELNISFAMLELIPDQNIRLILKDNLDTPIVLIALKNDGIYYFVNPTTQINEFEFNLDDNVYHNLDLSIDFTSEQVFISFNNNTITRNFYDNNNIDMYIKEVVIRSYDTCKASVHFNLFNILTNDDDLLIMNCSNLDNEYSTFYNYFYILFNINSKISIYTSYNNLTYNKSIAFHSTNFHNLSTGKNMFIDFYTIFNNSNINNNILLFYYNNSNVLLFKIFGLCMLTNAIYYGAIVPSWATDVNKMYGLNNALITNAYSESMYLNYFYISNNNHTLNYNVDFDDNSKDFLNLILKLDVKTSFHKSTYITFNSSRTPSLISKSYLTLGQWGTYGYYNQSIVLNDYQANYQVNIHNDNSTYSTFEFIYFNVSDINDYSFTNYCINGYISSFIVIYEITVPSFLNELISFIPIFTIIFIPSTAISYKIKSKTLLIPLILLFSFICLITFLIPLWQFFLILISLGCLMLIEEY